jgi:glycerol-3-phosphate O-acyltransferase
VEEALARFEKGRLLHRLKDDDGDILQVIEDKRVTLEYYKNGLLHFFVPVSLMAAAVRACREQADALPEAELQRLFAEQVLLLRSLGQTAQDDLLAYGALRREADGRLCAADPRLVAELAELTRNFVESYSLVLRAARALRSRDLSVAALPAKIQEVGRGLLAVEELVRPESLSAVNLSNAVRALREDGLLQLRTDGSGLQLDEEGTNALLANLKRMLA